MFLLNPATLSTCKYFAQIRYEGGEIARSRAVCHRVCVCVCVCVRVGAPHGPNDTGILAR